MTVPNRLPRPAAPLATPASPLYLREDEIRRGIELLYFGYTAMVRGADAILAREGFGRAHHRALYFIARRPGLPVGELLRLLGITKQSLGRVLGELQDKALVEQSIGTIGSPPTLAAPYRRRPGARKRAVHRARSQHGRRLWRGRAECRHRLLVRA